MGLARLMATSAGSSPPPAGGASLALGFGLVPRQARDTKPGRILRDPLLGH